MTKMSKIRHHKKFMHLINSFAVICADNIVKHCLNVLIACNVKNYPSRSYKLNSIQTVLRAVTPIVMIINIAIIPLVKCVMSMEGVDSLDLCFSKYLCAVKDEIFLTCDFFL